MRHWRTSLEMLEFQVCWSQMELQSSLMDSLRRNAGRKARCIQHHVEKDTQNTNKSEGTIRELKRHFRRAMAAQNVSEVLWDYCLCLIINCSFSDHQPALVRCSMTSKQGLPLSRPLEDLLRHSKPPSSLHLHLHGNGDVGARGLK